MTIFNDELYQKHLAKRQLLSKSWQNEILLPILLFGSVGAIAWAIRGTSGWGGVDGTVVPGLTWGLLWFYLCYRKGIDFKGIVFWLGLGLSIGGELGYGQYTSWIMGTFYAGNTTFPVSQFTGYLWFFICGLGWAAGGGIILGWALGKRVSLWSWFFRSLLMAILLIILFAWPFVEWLSQLLAKYYPELLFPNAELGLYNAELDKHLERTIYTNTQNFAVLIWWIGAILMAIVQKDKTTLFTGLLLGLGFGIGFMQSAVWCLGYGFAPNYIDWWKMWELNAGFNLGLLYAVTMYWAIRKIDEKRKDKEIKNLPLLDDKNNKSNEWIKTFYIAMAGSVLLYFMSFEYFLIAGLFLIAFYFVIILFSMLGKNSSFQISDFEMRRNEILFRFSIFLLLFLLFHGASSRAGIILELYTLEEADQYAWPLGRVALFLPCALFLVIALSVRIWRLIFKQPVNLKKNEMVLKVLNIITLIGFVGSLSIWPSKIGVLYALLIIVALYSFISLNLRFSKIDNSDIKSPISNTLKMKL